MNTLRRITNSIRNLRKRSFALNNLDLKLRPHLNFRDGFFVEAGANNGLDLSNTLFFEKYYGWRGILIEPIPELARQCRANRPRCIVENCALVPFDHVGSTVEMRFCNMMSLVKGAMKSEDRDLEHVKLGCAIQGIATYELTVAARTLTAVLDQYEAPYIHLLSLDVEGFESNVLKGLDFGRYRPGFMLIEARFRDEIDALLKPHYEIVADLAENDVLYKCRG